MPSNPGDTKDTGSQKNQPNGGSQGQKNAPQGGKQGSGQMSGGASSQNLRLQLTPEQQQQIRKATGKDASSLELSVQDIEDSLGASGSSESDATGSSSSRGESSSRGNSSQDEEMGSESEF